MDQIINLPVDVVVNIASQLWTILGIPVLLGLVTTWLVQKTKLNPNIPLIVEGKKWTIRGFVILVGTILQLAFYFMAGKEMGWELVQQVALTYLTASASYTHLFKL